MPRRSIVCLTAAALLLAGPAFAAGYEAELDPAPFDAATRADVIGSTGNVTAELSGNVLTVQGSFSHMTSPATGASLRIGLAKGVLGDVIGALTATHTPDGTVSGSVTLTRAQVDALRRAALYVRIDSEKAADGNLQGWLESK